MVQKSIQLELPLEGRGEAPRAERSGQAISAFCADEHSGIGSLMELVVKRERFWTLPTSKRITNRTFTLVFPDANIPASTPC